MSRYHVSRHATRDLDDIWLYVAQASGSIDTANNLIDEITDSFVGLARFPGQGRLREELSPGLRGWPVRKYLVFYRRIKGGVRIVRVIHGARDMRGIFDGGKD